MCFSFIAQLERDGVGEWEAWDALNMAVSFQ